MTGQAAHDMLKELGLDADCIVASFSRPDREITDAFNNLLERFLEYADDTYGILGRFYILYSLLMHKFKKNDKRLSSGYVHIREAVLLIGCTYMNPLFTIDDLCKNLNLSASYINRIMRKEFGMSPMQYLTFIRIKNACDLIAQTKFSFVQVAKMTGYLDSRYFSREFKKRTGLTPSEYRATHTRMPDGELFLQEKTTNKFIYAEKGGADI